MTNYVQAFISFAFIGPLLACSSSKTAGPKAAGEPAKLSSIKALSGYWEATTPNPETNKRDSVVYRVSSGGTAVEEILFPNTDHEMVSMYTQEGDTVTMTHYCMLGNQPRLRATSMDGNQMNFQFEGGTNLNPATDHHIHNMVLTFLGPDRIRHEWTGSKGSEKADGITVEFVRRN